VGPLPDPIGLYSDVLLSHTVPASLRQLDVAVHVVIGPSFGDQLFCVFELEDGRHRCILAVIHGGFLGPGCPDEGAHSPWTF
jgi:hypothetical protein